MQSNIRSAAVRSAAVRRIVAGLAAMPLAILAGCSIKSSTPPTNYNFPVTLQGQVFAGRNYMPGSTVKVYATQPDGVPTNGVYVGKAKLLATTTSNATGGWSLTGVSCSSPDQLYVTAEAGVPYPATLNTTTLVNNPNSLMMTAIGDCSILTSAATTTNVTSIVTNEASTVAAVWALRGFISLDGTTVNVTSSSTNYGGSGGVGTPGNFAGLAHAFLNANLLSPYKIGNFVQYTNGSADTTAGGLVPVQQLNSLAYAQYLCTIGSDGTSPGDFSYCTQLYQLATPPGGTAPTNSLQAMLDIADNPTNNKADILAFTLTPIPLSGQTGSQQINQGVYVPALTDFGSYDNDWSVSIFYMPPYGLTSTGQGTAVPEFVTVDSNDNVFFSNPNASTGTKGNVVALTSDGRSLWTSDTSTQLNQPRQIAADAFGNVWVVNGSASASGAFVDQFNAATGALVKQYPSTSTTLWGVAVDTLGNVWYSSNTATGQNLHELVRNGTTYSEATFNPVPAAPYQLLQLRPDSKNNIWVAGYLAAGGAAVYFPNTGSATAPTYTAGLVTAPLAGPASTYGIMPDASGNAYAVTNGAGGGVWKVAVSGSGASSVLTATNVGTNPATAARLLDIDGAGSVWYLDDVTGGYVFQYIPSSATTNHFFPCFNTGTTSGTGTATKTVQTCAYSLSYKYDLAIDSTGSVWVASYGNGAPGGRIAQMIGVAAPTVPLKALGHPGVMP